MGDAGHLGRDRLRARGDHHGGAREHPGALVHGLEMEEPAAHQHIEAVGPALVDHRLELLAILDDRVHRRAAAHRIDVHRFTADRDLVLALAGLAQPDLHDLALLLRNLVVHRSEPRMPERRPNSFQESPGPSFPVASEARAARCLSRR